MAVPGQRCVSCGRRIRGEFIGKMWHSQRCALLLMERLFVSVPDVISLLPPKWRFDQASRAASGRRQEIDSVVDGDPVVIPCVNPDKTWSADALRKRKAVFYIGDLGRLALDQKTGHWWFAAGSANNPTTKYVGPYRNKRTAILAEQRYLRVRAEWSAAHPDHEAILDAIEDA